MIHISTPWISLTTSFDVATHAWFSYNFRPKASLPSNFLKKRATTTKTRSEKLFTYDRDIICLPKSHGKSSEISIPRARTQLAMNGLIGKIRLSSEMSQEDIFTEIRSVFRGAMDGSNTFRFHVLQPAGGNSKSLTIPALSESFRWTASAIVLKNAKVPLYILAKQALKVCLY